MMTLKEIEFAHLAGGVNSPVRSFNQVNSGDPIVVDRGENACLIDTQGRRYLDLCMSYGVAILGHTPDRVRAAVHQQIEKGCCFGLNTPAEGKLADLVHILFPSMEKIRFVSTGTEATLSALRLARACTGRTRLIKFDGNYHGHGDPFLVKAGSGLSHFDRETTSTGLSPATLQETQVLPYNRIEPFRAAICDQVAAVIVEPVAANMGVIPADRAFLHALREETRRHGTLLIFDEIVSGFRNRSMGAQQWYGIEPDLTCLGKILGGGFPVAAFGGDAYLMDQLTPKGRVYQAGTFSGHPVGMSAGLATLHEVADPSCHLQLEASIDLLLQPIEERLSQAENGDSHPVVLTRFGSCFSLFWGCSSVRNRDDLKQINHKLFSSFFHFLLQRGIYISPSPFEASFISTAHTRAQLLGLQEAILAFMADRSCD